MGICVGVCLRVVRTLLHKQFLLVSVSPSVSGSVNKNKGYLFDIRWIFDSWYFQITWYGKFHNIFRFVSNKQAASHSMSFLLEVFFNVYDWLL